MQKLKHTRMFLMLLAFLSLATPGRTAETLTYVLLPGSTYTPSGGGKSEPLTGTFQWQEYPTFSTTLGFDAVSLSFASPSFTFTLNTTPLNDHATSVHQGSSVTSFSEVVEITGLRNDTAVMLMPVAGSYTGPAHAPTSLSYSQILLGPLSGGATWGTMDFSAALVPEPSALTFASLAGILMIGYRSRHKLKGS